MPEPPQLVINTGPILALVAALGDLEVLRIYPRVLVPCEVCDEISAGGPKRFALTEFAAAHWLQRRTHPLDIMPVLLNTLDSGEAAVIQLALDEGIPTVCIDEATGRRMARLNNLNVTGSIGVLLRAKREGYTFSMRDAIRRMKAHGIWLSSQVTAFALTQAGESTADDDSP